MYEGYGMINPDAAVEAVSQPLMFGTTNTFMLGSAATDPRAWARNVNLPANANFSVNLTVPATGDYDLYLYSASPGLYGKPMILASSTTPGNGQNESFTYQSSTNTTAYLVVKRVSGSGSFNLVGNVPSQLVVLPGNVDFGLLTSGISAQTILVISNAGPGQLNGSAALLNADEFSILSGTPFTIAAQASTNLLVQFAPLDTGSFTNNLAFVSNGGYSTNQVTGRAIAVPTLLSPTVDPINFNFSFTTTAGFTYLIQYKNTLDDAAWETLDSQPGDGTPHTYSVPVAGLPQRFYRILIQ